MPKEYKSKGKTEIVNFLREHNTHRLTVAEILDGLEKEGKNINRSTIYRNLERLTDSGNVICYKGSDSEAAFYQYSGEDKKCNTHLHLQCITCGKIFHLKHDFVDDFMQQLLHDYKVELDVSHTMLVGECEVCRKKKVKG